MMDMATAVSDPGDVALRTPTDTLFINQMKDHIHDNHEWLHLVNSERVRKDVGHKLVASERKRTQAQDHRVNGMVSYDGKAVKIIELMHHTKHGYSKAKVRSVTHDEAKADIVNFVDLSPMGSVRPELMNPSNLDFSIGKFTFFAVEGNNTVVSGIITKRIGPDLMVHVHRQANKKDRRFVPLYTLSGSSTPVPKEKPPKSATRCMIVVAPSSVLGTTDLTNFAISEQALPGLQSRGIVIIPPKKHDKKNASFDEIEKTTMPITHAHITSAPLNPLAHTYTRTVTMMPITISSMNPANQVVYMQALRSLATTLLVSPFGRPNIILMAVHSALQQLAAEQLLTTMAHGPFSQTYRMTILHGTRLFRN